MFYKNGCQLVANSFNISILSFSQQFCLGLDWSRRPEGLPAEAVRFLGASPGDGIECHGAGTHWGLGTGYHVSFHDLGFSVFLANDELGTGLRVTELAYLVTLNFAVLQDPGFLSQRTKP